MNDKEHKYEVNNAIIEALNNEMDQVESDTISAKAELFIYSATDEWLDYWGSWFGLHRKKGQSDHDYRNALIEHVEHPRDTIPALRSAIAKFLQSDVSAVHIYEPWTDIFILNDSNLNSKAHLMSDYYQYGVIDVQINKPFNSGIIDILNWFRAGGVIWVLTYAPEDGPDTDIWKMSPTYASEYAELTELEEFIGTTQHLNKYLTFNTHATDYGLSTFILNASQLNSNNTIEGTEAQSAPYFNSLGYLKGLVTPDINDNMYQFDARTLNVDSSYYDLVSGIDDTYYPFNISEDVKNYNLLNDTEKMDQWSTSAGNLMIADTYQGNPLMEFNSTQATTFSPNKVHLEQGKEYRLSLFARSGNLTNDATLKLIIGNPNLFNHTLTPKLTNQFNKLTDTFTFNQPTGDYVVQIQAKFDQKAALYVLANQFMLTSTTLPMLGWGTVIPDWMPSATDYPADYTYDRSYIYGTFDIFKFFFDNVQSEAITRSLISGTYDYHAIGSYIDSFIRNKDLIVAFKTDDKFTEKPQEVTAVYNFRLKTWVKFSADNITNQRVKQSIQIDNLQDYVNSKGLMFITMMVDCIGHDYHLGLDTMQFYMDKTVKGNFAFNLYAKDQPMTDELQLAPTKYFDDNTTTDDLFDRHQDGYPMRYIRLSYQALDDQSGAITATGDNTYITGDVDSTSSDDYSLSTLGLKFNDSVHNNLLGDLSSFKSAYYVNNPNWITDGDSFTDDTLNDVHAVKLSGQSGIISATSNGLFNFTNYRLEMSIKVSKTAPIATTTGTTSTTTQLPLSGTLVVNVYGTSKRVKELLGTFEVDSVKSGDVNNIKIPFNIHDYTPEYLTIEVVYQANQSMDLTIQNPAIYLDYSYFLDNQLINAKLPDLYRNADGKLAYDDMKITDKKLHILTIDLGKRFFVNSAEIGFGSGTNAKQAYEWQLETSVDGQNYVAWQDQDITTNTTTSTTSQTTQNNLSGQPVQTTIHKTIPDNLPHELKFLAYNQARDETDYLNPYSVSTGYPDSDVSHGRQLFSTYSISEYLFGSNNTIDLSIAKSGQKGYTIYHSLFSGTDHLNNPSDTGKMDKSFSNTNDSINTSDLIKEAKKYQGVYGYLVDYAMVDRKFPDTFKLSDYTGTTSTTTLAPQTSTTTTSTSTIAPTTTSTTTSTTTKNPKDFIVDSSYLNSDSLIVDAYLPPKPVVPTPPDIPGGGSDPAKPYYTDQYIVRFNLYQHINDKAQGIFDKLSFTADETSDKISFMKQLIQDSQPQFKISNILTSTSDQATYGAIFNFKDNKWDNIAFDSDKGSLLINITSDNVSDYISDSGLVDVTYYSYATYDLNNPVFNDLLTIEDFNLPIVIDGKTLDNSNYSPTKHPIIVTKYRSLVTSDNTVTIPIDQSKVTHQGILALNVVSPDGQGTIQVGTDKTRWQTTLPLEQGHQHFEISLDFDKLDQSDNLTIKLVGSNALVEIPSMIIENGTEITNY